MNPGFAGDYRAVRSEQIVIGCQDRRGQSYTIEFGDVQHVARTGAGNDRVTSGGQYIGDDRSDVGRRIGGGKWNAVRTCSGREGINIVAYLELVADFEALTATEVEDKPDFEFEGYRFGWGSDRECVAIGNPFAWDRRKFDSTALWVIGTEVTAGVELEADLDVSLSGQRTEVDPRLSPTLVIEGRRGNKAASEGVLVAVARHIVLAKRRENRSVGIGLIDVARRVVGRQQDPLSIFACPVDSERVQERVVRAIAENVSVVVGRCVFGSEVVIEIHHRLIAR